MAQGNSWVADEYKVGAAGRLVYLHFGQETEEERAQRQSLFLRVADSLGLTANKEDNDDD
jgi:hypothetical protein